LKIEDHLVFLHSLFDHVISPDTRAFTPELIIHEESPEFEAETGSFSPQLLHGEETEAIDPDEDRALLVGLLKLLMIYFFSYFLCLCFSAGGWSY